jgi:heme o synthase
VLGLIYLALTVNLLTAALGAVTMAATFCLHAAQTHHHAQHGHRRHSRRAAAADGLDGGPRRNLGEGWSLFAILCFWQLPHFLAIAWMYRDEYAKAGFVMLPVVDPTGERTGRQALSHTLGLLPVSLCPFFFKMVGPVYLAGPFCWAGLSLVRVSIFAAIDLATGAPLFFASIIYLPSLLGLMVFDKIRN